jgi:hypothetical protein
MLKLVVLTSVLGLASSCARGAVHSPTPPAHSRVPITYEAWNEAVDSHDARRVEALIGVPAWVYYDDAWTGARPEACQRWVLHFQPIASEGDRALFARCVAATVTLSNIADPTHPTGTLSIDQLVPLVPPEIVARLRALAPDHRFVHGHAGIEGDYDFTLAIPAAGGGADLIALTTIRGD